MTTVDTRSIDFNAIAALLADYGWYPEDGVREILRCDAGAVRIIVMAEDYCVQFGDPFIGGVAEVWMPRGSTSYGLVKVLAENVRLIVNVATIRKEI